jgi:hypothetical protein
MPYEVKLVPVKRHEKVCCQVARGVGYAFRQAEEDGFQVQTGEHTIFLPLSQLREAMQELEEAPVLKRSSRGRL